MNPNMQMSMSMAQYSRADPRAQYARAPQAPQRSQQAKRWIFKHRGPEAMPRTDWSYQDQRGVDTRRYRVPDHGFPVFRQITAKPDAVPYIYHTPEGRSGIIRRGQLRGGGNYRMVAPPRYLQTRQQVWQDPSARLAKQGLTQSRGPRRYVEDEERAPPDDKYSGKLRMPKSPVVEKKPKDPTPKPHTPMTPACDFYSNLFPNDPDEEPDTPPAYNRWGGNFKPELDRSISDQAWRHNAPRPKPGFGRSESDPLYEKPRKIVKEYDYVKDTFAAKNAPKHGGGMYTPTLAIPYHDPESPHHHSKKKAGERWGPRKPRINPWAEDTSYQPYDKDAPVVRKQRSVFETTEMEHEHEDPNEPDYPAVAAAKAEYKRRLAEQQARMITLPRGAAIPQGYRYAGRQTRGYQPRYQQNRY